MATHGHRGGLEDLVRGTERSTACDTEATVRVLLSRRNVMGAPPVRRSCSKGGRAGLREPCGVRSTPGAGPERADQQRRLCPYVGRGFSPASFPSGRAVVSFPAGPSGRAGLQPRLIPSIIQSPPERQRFAQRLPSGRARRTGTRPHALGGLPQPAGCARPTRCPRNRDASTRVLDPGTARARK